MASIFKRDGKGPWLIEFTNARGKTSRRSSKTKDYRLAQQIAANYERAVAEERAGLSQVTRSREPLAELIEEYCRDLERVKRTPYYVKSRRRLLGKIICSTRWREAGDLQPQGLTRVLSRLAGKAGRTLNEYRDAAVWFGTWLVKTGRLAANPLTTVSRGREDKVYVRRALTRAELKRLLAAAPPKRAFIYALMATSGLRRSETRKVTTDDVDTAGPQWRWTLRASVTKSRRAETVQMTEECQEVLARVWSDLPTHGKIVTRVPAHRTYQKDLRAAGIPNPDGAGRRADLHSLRYTFCTELSKVLPIQTVKVLMRHRDINLTAGLYLDLGLTDAAEAVKKVPRFLTGD